MLTGAFANLLLNTLIAVLLCITIAYCWLLNKRIKIMQDSKGELALLLKHFDNSTRRASESIIALQSTSKKIGESIEGRIEKANSLIDDISYMIDKGDKIASKLEASFAVNRARERVNSDQVPIAVKPTRAVKIETPIADDDEQEEEVQLYSSEKNLNIREKKLASLETVLERVVARSQDSDEEPLFPEAGAAQNGSSQNGGLRSWPPQNKPERPAGMTRERSKAEQELLDMIKSGIKT